MRLVLTERCWLDFLIGPLRCWCPCWFHVLMGPFRGPRLASARLLLATARLSRVVPKGLLTKVWQSGISATLRLTIKSRKAHCQARAAVGLRLAHVPSHCKLHPAARCQTAVNGPHCFVWRPCVAWTTPQCTHDVTASCNTERAANLQQLERPLRQPLVHLGRAFTSAACAWVTCHDAGSVQYRLGCMRACRPGPWISFGITL
jgi:hypothetical protein